MTAREAAAAPGGAGDLPDLNVWLALALVEHPHHRAARAYWYEAAARRIWFCRVTMLGLVRLLAQPRLMGKATLGLREAFDLYLRFAALPELPRVETNWQPALLAVPPLAEGAQRRRL